MSESVFAVSLKLTMKMRKAVLTPPSEKRTLGRRANTRTQRALQRKPHYTRMLNLKQKPNKGTLCCLSSLAATHFEEDRYLGFMASWKSFFTAVILAFCANTSLVTRSKASSGHHLMHCGSPLSLHKSQT